MSPPFRDLLSVSTFVSFRISNNLRAVRCTIEKRNVFAAIETIRLGGRFLHRLFSTNESKFML